MSNVVEYNDKLAFHPGYYVKELVDESGLTQEDFAKRIGTTPKNLSIIINGEQRLSQDIAIKLSRITGTSIDYWLNLQKQFDAFCAEIESNKELKNEKKILKYLDYSYFRENFHLKDLPRDTDAQVIEIRKYLGVSSLMVLTQRDMAVNFRSTSEQLTEANIVKANAMVQIATNHAIKYKAPKYNKTKFSEAVSYALTLTRQHDSFYELIKKAFYNAGVIFEILPNISGSKTNGATKKIGNNIMLMVNDRRLNADTFWFTLFHEIGHIINDDYGISFDKETGEKEKQADRFAEDQLIPPDAYTRFIKRERFGVEDIKSFANQINRDPGIVLGRLQNDRYVNYRDRSLQVLRTKYHIIITA